ncbi:sigma-70 family RNA polymerase sigma factor [Streptococcus acidominimus]|uniref:Phage protein n=1 Tax=Streptococcus acidominimus TaxID=1326 RepID=A0A1Q8ED90_STRAI|nr:sigma-70 family RNA polymerase sigma factor [Streptococcus acidominimus]OLF49747.1 hypothetical protein BU200_05625 [Streptococcus acidominimus]QBX07884.1 hypothetical protein JavanS2_0004 [Streptococcus satellite phage Javan2]SUN06022.1 phage protein [Streptococcus acidominimus]
MDFRQRLEELHTIGLLMASFEAELKKDRQLCSSLPSALANVEQAHLKRIEELQGQQQAMLDLISKLDNPTYRRLLLERYQNGRGWKEVADLIGYSLSNTYRLHKKALERLENINEQEAS